MRDERMRALCGVLAICGHIWTVFLLFKGGKGVATTVGVFLGLTWLSTLIALGVFVVAVYLTRYISLGSILLGVTLCVGSLLLRPRIIDYMILGAIAAALIIFTHRANIRRLINGTENKLGKKVGLSEGTSS